MSRNPIGQACAVVVTFNPDDVFAANLEKLASEITEIVVVDNASQPDRLVLVRRACESSGARLIENAENLGIATALNQGARYAIEHGYAWLATFDQDSQVVAGMIGEMFDALNHCALEMRKDVALICPVLTDQRSGALMENIPADGRRSDPVNSAITSGCLVKLACWQQLGPFDDKLFIDYVDHEYCLRVLSNGLLILKAYRASLLHSLGEFQRHRIGKFSLTATHHSPLRRYYIMRNRLVVWSRYWRAEPSWVRGDMIATVKDCIKVLLVEDRKLSKIAATFSGAYDFAVGKFGRRTTLPASK